MASSWGQFLHLDIFGESHGPAIGVVVNGLPPGECVDLSALQTFMERRAPGRAKTATARHEADAVEIVSGLLNDHTTGAPLAALIRNGDARSGDYDKLRDLPRPGHADYPASVRYDGANDIRGGGHFSGRLTAPLCIAGGIALQVLRHRGIVIGGHLLSVGPVQDDAFDAVTPSAEALLAPGRKSFPVINDDAGQLMTEVIEAAQAECDSVGGRIEVVATGIPVGLGSPMFDGVENRLASLLFGIPAVRGVEFGYGMGAAELRGSQHNDAYCMIDGAVRTKTNHHGGVLGGITTGMPLVVKLAIKPTPSIGREQQTVSLSRGTAETLSVTGRHDTCIAPRAVPVAEAAVAVAVLDLLLERQK